MSDRPRRPAGSKARSGARLSREEGTVIKDWGGRLPIALIYPNSYFLGMSNLGIHSIYNLLNSSPKFVCERVFWERENRDKHLPPLSIESQRPLSDFAVLAFSVSFELDYLNIVPILKSGGIPVYAADRDERHPLVIAGGACITTNPVPLAPFFDCLCIGEAEPILPAMLAVLLQGIGGRRDELLKALAALPGIYVPACPYRAPVRRQCAENLDDLATTSVVLTPDTELGDMYLVEVERGCYHGCRFCLVSTAYAPMRCRSVDKLVEQARHGLRYRKRIGLLGPAVTDHPRILELLVKLREIGAELSISSLRISSLSEDILSELSRGGLQTVTIAPEAGSARLRQVVKKDISENEIFEVIDRVARLGLKQLKLYFMIGLPSETDEDIADIIKLTLRAKESIESRKSRTRITVNVAPFVPKAGTPFQWLPMAPLYTLNHRLSLLRKSLPARGIKLNTESPGWSQVQGVLSRGDAGVADVLANLDEISLPGWRKAVEKSQLDADYYVNQKWDTGQRLPWNIIESGTETEHLKNDLEKALAK